MNYTPPKSLPTLRMPVTSYTPRSSSSSRGQEEVIVSKTVSDSKSGEQIVSKTVAGNTRTSVNSAGPLKVSTRKPASSGTKSAAETVADAVKDVVKVVTGASTPAATPAVSTPAATEVKADSVTHSEVAPTDSVTGNNKILWIAGVAGALAIGYLLLKKR